MNSKHVDFRVRSIFDDLTRSERKIARFILDQPEEVIKMTASELAKVSKTSPASVIRFCKSIGIPSFPELKLELSAERDAPITQEYSDILPNEKLSDLKSKLLGNAYQAMKETVQLADEALLLKASSEIADASIIYVYGVGSSYLVAENVAQKWNRIGKVCICMSDVHLLIASLTSAHKKTLFIGISNSGETAEVISLTSIAQKRGIRTLSITEFGMNSLSKKADVTLSTVRSKEVALRSAATSSLMSQFMLIDVLFYTYVLEEYETHMENILHSRESVDEYKRLTTRR